MKKKRAREFYISLYGPPKFTGIWAIHWTLPALKNTEPRSSQELKYIKVREVLR